MNGDDSQIAPLRDQTKKPIRFVYAAYECKKKQHKTNEVSGVKQKHCVNLLYIY